MRSKCCFAHLSTAIGTKRNVLTANLTVKLVRRRQIELGFKELRALETIEWE
jgi:hypothetical protein